MSKQTLQLQGVVDGTLYALDNRTLYTGPAVGSLRPRGKIPAPADGGPAYRLASTYGILRSALSTVVGDFMTATVHPLGDGALLATTGGHIFVSTDRGHSWESTHPLPPSSPSFGVLPCATCRHEGTIYVGEYPLAGSETPRVLQSEDGGQSWSGIEVPGVRHIHSVAVDPYTDDIWITTGDRDEECWIGRLRHGQFEPVGGGSQRWRAVEIAFTPDSILWGVDCLYAANNELLRLDRDQFEAAKPTPTVLHRVDGSVFYNVTTQVGDTLWVVFSTGALSGKDSTAPEQTPHESNVVTIVASSTASDFTEWYELGRYRKRRTLADVVPSKRLTSANAYAFLAADGERLFLNPYNTVQNNGRILCTQLPIKASVSLPPPPQ